MWGLRTPFATHGHLQQCRYWLEREHEHGNRSADSRVRLCGGMLFDRHELDVSYRDGDGDHVDVCCGSRWCLPDGNWSSESSLVTDSSLHVEACALAVAKKTRT